MYGKALNEARVRYSDSFSIGLKICYKMCDLTTSKRGNIGQDRLLTSILLISGSDNYFWNDLNCYTCTRPFFQS
jgi:hypothetical protein